MSRKTAIVTGAARGIGLATTRALLAAGYRVAMIDRDGAALKSEAAALGAMCGRCCATCRCPIRFRPWWPMCWAGAGKSTRW